MARLTPLQMKKSYAAIAYGVVCSWSDLRQINGIAYHQEQLKWLENKGFIPLAEGEEIIVTGFHLYVKVNYTVAFSQKAHEKWQLHEDFDQQLKRAGFTQEPGFLLTALEK